MNNLCAVPLSLCVVIVAAASIANAQNAQDPQATSVMDMSLDELLGLQLDTDMASLMSESRREAAASVSVVTRADWVARAAQRFTDAYANLPGVLSVPYSAGVTTTSIRGYTSGNSGAGVAFSLDGIPLNWYHLGDAGHVLPNWQLPTLDRIEIFRGPGSAVYGADAFFGVVALTPFRSDVNVSEAGTMYADNGFLQSYGRVSHGVGALRVHTSLSYASQPDQQFRMAYFEIGSDKFIKKNFKDEQRTFSGSTKAEWQYHDLKLSAGYYHHEHRAVDLLDVATSTIGNDPKSNGDQRLQAAKVSAEYAISSTQHVELMLYGWNLERDNLVSVGNLTPIGGLQLNNDSDFDAYRQGAKLLYRASVEPLNTSLVAGLQSDKNASRHSFGDDFTTTIGPNVVGSGRNIKASGKARLTQSAFVSLQTKLLDDKLRINWGGRGDFFSDVGGQYSPRLGVVFLPHEAWAFKLLYGRAFRPPGAGEIHGGSVLVGGGDDVVPEVIHSLELVAQLQMERINVSVSGFASKFSDPIQIHSNAQQQYGYGNVGSADSYGAELELEARYHGFIFNGNGSYIVSTNRGTEAGSYDDVEYFAFPRTIVNAGVGYGFEEPSIDIYAMTRLMADYKIGPALPPATNRDAPTYARTDITVAWNASPYVVVTAAARNVFGRVNRFSSAFGSSGVGLRDIPQTFVLSLTVKSGA